MAALYESIMVPIFGYTIAKSHTTVDFAPLLVPWKLKLVTLLIGFGLLYSKELMKGRFWRKEELIKTPAGTIKVKKHN